MREARTLSGFRDILPDNASVKESMLNSIKEVFKSFGFVPIETPHLEYAEVLVGKGSEEIQKELYKFRDHGGRDVALRFDQTVPLARFVVQHKHMLASPFKRYAIGNVFRGERAQAGRYREFTQCDFDFIGTNSILSDMEIIQVINNALVSLGIENFTIKINNRKILNGLAKYFKVENKIEDILRIVDKIDKIGEDKVKEELLESAGIDNNAIDEIIKFISIKQQDENFFALVADYKTYNEQMKEGIEELEAIFDILASLDIKKENYQVDFSIARGLAYYTGTVYETILNDLPSMGSVCSGGRYDNLTKSFSKDDNMSGVGASIGIDRLIAALEKLELIKGKNTTADVLILNIDTQYISNIHQIAQELRQKKINVEVYPETMKFKKQMKYANNKGHEFVIILGENEIENGIITLKNMINGEQQNIKNIDDIVSVIKS
ncbi:MAG: Histidyl-tRNA synthetase (EC [uncultured Sulfurovum sp.]|uniref:Histidine--tRNA ligase n=1 Tax=uncultured Sulfurovum sp. TaxID=269237 RepID=A0A6S6SH52_9BACT|nr:MAG: Histidyl-tRNA synthetase (EC [uncultured Sulfurovum sp.]